MPFRLQGRYVEPKLELSNILKNLRATILEKRVWLVLYLPGLHGKDCWVQIEFQGQGGSRACEMGVRG